MMMPANYSALAENEMVYVEGGANFLGLPKQLSTLSTNVINIVANSYIPSVIGASLGELFDPEYKFGDASKGIWHLWTGAAADGTGVTGTNAGTGDQGKYKATWLGGGMQIVGTIAAIAQLMNNDVKPLTSNKVLNFTTAKGYY